MSSLSHLLRLIRGAPRWIPLWLADGRSESPRDTVLLIARGSELDADTMPLLWTLMERRAWRVAIAVESKSEFESSCGWFVAPWRDRLQVVERDAHEFDGWLLRSFLVVLTSGGDLVDQRLASRRGRRSFVRLYHGLITKAYGRLTAERVQRRTNRVLDVLVAGSLNGLGVDVHSVASEVEGFFRAAADGGDPAFYKPYGYPRYDRLAELRDGAAPWLPDESLEVLEATHGKKRILYAPTHKDGRAATTLFPLEGYSLEKLHRFLRRENCVLLLRMHLREEEGGAYDALVDGETVLRAGRSLSVSPIELFPFVDVLVTDYSSIYMDFLPFDRPVVFVKDRHDHFTSARGLAFDYERYFPGHKATHWDDFAAALARGIEGADGCESERRFVRDALLPPLSGSFLERLLNDSRVRACLP